MTRGYFLLRFNDDAYTMVDYFQEQGSYKKLERTLPMRFFGLQYNDVPVDYDGVKLKVVRKEMVYKNKLAMQREKDLFDLEKLAPWIDQKRLEDMRGMHRYRKTIIVDL